MNRNELVENVAKDTGLSKADSDRALGSVIEQISASLSKGNEVRLIGFGTFAVARRSATTGRNPRTGASINIPAATLPKFKAGKALKQRVNR